MVHEIAASTPLIGCCSPRERSCNLEGGAREYFNFQNMTATITRTRNNLCGSHPPIHFPAEPGTKKNQSFGDMRIPGNIGPVSLVPVCAMRVINGLPPANLICFIINPTKAVWARAGLLECMRVQVAWSGNYPPHGNHHHCLHSVRTQHWSCPASAPLTVMLGQYSTAAGLGHYFQRVSRAQSTS